MLTSSGYDVLTASDGESALEIVQDSKVDLIILDAVILGMHGLDICRALKRNHKTKGIPVLIYSALGTGIDMMLNERDKADAYISKPFTQQELLEKIRELLN
jgi:DNA-binding response OmpR family regulator